MAGTVRLSLGQVPKPMESSIQIWNLFAINKPLLCVVLLTLFPSTTAILIHTTVLPPWVWMHPNIAGYHEWTTSWNQWCATFWLRSHRRWSHPLLSVFSYFACYPYTLFSIQLVLCFIACQQMHGGHMCLFLYPIAWSAMCSMVLTPNLIQQICSNSTSWWWHAALHSD